MWIKPSWFLNVQVCDKQLLNIQISPIFVPQLHVCVHPQDLKFRLSRCIPLLGMKTLQLFQLKKLSDPTCALSR